MTQHFPVLDGKPVVRVASPKISKEEFLAAIERGVHDAMWHMITNRTMAPCADFYAAVEDGVATGIERAQQVRTNA